MASYTGADKRLQFLFDMVSNFATDYNNSSTYAVRAYAIYQGILYKCITAVTTAEDFDNTKWARVLAMSEISSGGGGGSVVSITPTLTSGTKIADFSINGVSDELYAPSGGSGSDDYSTTEQVIGTWLGETLYRKVIPITANWNFAANTWVKSNIPRGDMKAIINGRIEIFSNDVYSLHFVSFGFIDNMIAGNSFRAFTATANGANLILEYTKTTD